MNSKFFYFKRLIGRSYKKSNMQIIIYDPNVVGIIPKNFNYYYHVYFCEFFNEIIWFNFLRVNIYLFVGLLELQEQSVSLRSLFAEITCFPICYFLAGYWCIKCLARIIHRFYEYGKVIYIKIKKKINLMEIKNNKNIFYTNMETNINLKNLILYSVIGTSTQKLGMYIDSNYLMESIETMNFFFLELSSNFLKDFDFSINFDSNNVFNEILNLKIEELNNKKKMSIFYMDGLEWVECVRLALMLSESLVYLQESQNMNIEPSGNSSLEINENKKSDALIALELDAYDIMKLTVIVTTIVFCGVALYFGTRLDIIF